MLAIVNVTFPVRSDSPLPFGINGDKTIISLHTKKSIVNATNIVAVLFTYGPLMIRPTKVVVPAAYSVINVNAFL